ncbi:MAG: hypothetical protein FE78DRAFT_424679 [Acidomyces sp. 'richmondensis']|nr:MAG: hypothetical protein FE78DRAFT_424679 [Acidomyces sp. 'richmondensis']
MSETDDRDRRRDPADHPETQDETAHHPTEHTPLLPSSSTSSTNSPPTGTGSSRRSLFSFLRPRRAHPNDYTANVGNRKPHSAARWPSIFALILLSTLVICIIIFYFLAPSLIESYAHQAAFFHPTTLSLLAYTPTGASLRLTGDFSLNASRVRRKPTRDLGRAFTALVQKVETGEANVEVVLPEYGNVVVGTAKVPGVKVDLRDGRRTHVDVEVDTQVGDMEGLKRIIGDWVDGRLGALRVRGTAKMSLRSGIFGLGRQTVEKEFVLAEDDMPTLPPYQIQGFRLSEVDTPSPPPADDDDEKPKKGIAAFISLLVQNDYPLTLTLPPLAFDLLVANCDNHPIPLALASTPSLPIHAHAPLELNATALIPSFPEPLIHPCPKIPHSPLDVLLHRFLRGRETTIYVRGATTTAFPSTPTWLADFLRDIVVPLPVPGKTFTGNLIRNFSMENTSFHLPDPFATPGTPAANPQISADVRALVALPDGTQHVPLNVSRVRAAAEVLYHGAKVGNLDLRKWQEGRSSQVNESEGLLEVWSRVERAPLEITDEDVFAEVVRDLVWGTHDGAGVVMGIKAEVDVEVRTVLGKMKIRGIPAKGQVPLKGT